MPEPEAAQFYTGLVADLYEELAGERADPDDYAPFLRANPPPYLELGCGTGIPILGLRQRGLEVEGVDASLDMLARCRERAATLGIEVALHHQTMQDLALPRRYGAIFLAGATFTVLESDAAARQALLRMRAHLLPGGRVMIPLEQIPAEEAHAGAGRARERVRPDGTRIRVTVVSVQVDPAARRLRRRLRYERIGTDGQTARLERDFETLWWEPQRFREMLLEAGFASPRAVLPGGGDASEDSRVFVFLARAPQDAGSAAVSGPASVTA